MLTDMDLAEIHRAARVNAIQSGLYPDRADAHAAATVRRAVLQNLTAEEGDYFTFIDYSGLTESVAVPDLEDVLAGIRRDDTRLRLITLSSMGQGQHRSTTVGPADFDRLVAAHRDCLRKRNRRVSLRDLPTLVTTG